MCVERIGVKMVFFIYFIFLEGKKKLPILKPHTPESENFELGKKQNKNKKKENGESSLLFSLLVGTQSLKVQSQLGLDLK